MMMNKIKREEDNQNEPKNEEKQQNINQNPTNN
jgi:hypothetical protein